METTHLSEIIEASYKSSVVIFKYSSQCASSDRLKTKIAKMIHNSTLALPVYLVIVQKHRALSRKIEDVFSTKHQTPQILVIEKSKVKYTAHHGNIDLDYLVQTYKVI